MKEQRQELEAATVINSLLLICLIRLFATLYYLSVYQMFFFLCYRKLLRCLSSDAELCPLILINVHYNRYSYFSCINYVYRLQFSLYFDSTLLLLCNHCSFELSRTWFIFRLSSLLTINVVQTDKIKTNVFKY